MHLNTKFQLSNLNFTDIQSFKKFNDLPKYFLEITLKNAPVLPNVSSQGSNIKYFTDM